MTTTGKRTLAVLAALVLSFWFSVAWHSADECAHTEGCGAHHQPYDKTARGIVSQPLKDVPAEDPITRYTYWLMVFTGLLVLVTGVQGYLLIRAERIALMMAKATRRQVRMARREFLASHRPRMTVQFIDATIIAVGQHPRAKIRVVNRGESHAIIFAVGADIIQRTPRGYHIQQITAAPVPLTPIQTAAPGQQLEFDITAGTALTFAHHASINNATIELCVIGAIRYRDRNDIERFTGFFRVYDPVEIRYRRVSADDWHGDYAYET